MEKKKFITDKLVFYTGLIYFVIMALFVCIKICAYFGLFQFNGSSIVFKLLVQIGLMAVLPILMFSWLCKKKVKQTFETFGFKKISVKAVFVSLAMGACVFILVGYISTLWSGFLSLFGYKFSVGSQDYSVVNFILSIFLVGVLPGVCEEISHRGLILSGTKHNGTIRSIILCGLLFGLMHFNPAQFGYAFVVGMFFAFITLLTKSIFPAMIMHFTNNTLSTIVSYSENSTWFPSGITDWTNNFLSSGNTILIVIVNVLVCALTFVLLCWLMMKLFVESKKSQFERFQKNFKREISQTSLVEDINPDDKTQVMEIYRELNMLNVEKRLKEGNISPQEILEGINSKKTAELVLSDNFSLPEKKKASNYIFYYMSIFLGALGTIFFFILNIL